jgi:hypothetical protein
VVVVVVLDFAILAPLADDDLLLVRICTRLDGQRGCDELVMRGRWKVPEGLEVWRAWMGKGGARGRLEIR